jgi:hypothetical protein
MLRVEMNRFVKEASPMRFVTAAAFILLALSGQALAGASSANFATPAPDPDTKSMSRAQVRDYAAKGCQISQAKLMSTAPEELRSPCNCYAGKTVNGMTTAELQFFRDKSYFDDTTRAKALAAIDACKLKRPI